MNHRMLLSHSLMRYILWLFCVPTSCPRCPKLRWCADIAFKFRIPFKTLQLSTNSGYGAIHAAILSLSTRSLAYGQPFKNIAPQTDAEEQEAATLAFGNPIYNA